MPAYGDLVHDTTSSTGTGTLTLAAVNGKRTFNTAFGTGGTDAFDYYISHRSAAEWERGTGHLSAATTLVRDTVLASSNAGAAVNFSAGAKDVTNDQPAGLRLDNTRSVVSGNGLSGGGNLTADRTLAVGAGTGITVGADDVALTVPVAVANGGTGSTTAAGALAALGADAKYVDKVAGDTMTGNLVLNTGGGSTSLDMRYSTGGHIDIRTINNDAAGGAKPRWLFRLNDGSLETGSNAGSNISLLPVNDDNTATLGPPFTISRADSRITLIGDPTAALHAATKQYVDQTRNPNYVINGSMQIGQRAALGTLYDPTGAARYGGADRWSTLTSAAAGVFTTGQVDISGTTVSYARRATSSTATQQLFFRHIIETKNVLKLIGKTATLSFYAAHGPHYSAASANIGVQVTTGTGIDQGLASLNAATWTGLATVVNTVSPVNLYSITRHSFTFAVAADVREIAITFYFSPSGTAGTDDSLWFTDVQLEEGASASAFEHILYGQELLACQRYYYQGPPAVHGVAYSTVTAARMNALHPVTMRASPTVTMTSPVGLISGGTLHSVSSISNTSNTSYLEFDGTTTGLTVGQAVGGYGGSGLVTVDAEL